MASITANKLFADGTTAKLSAETVDGPMDVVLFSRDFQSKHGVSSRRFFVHTDEITVVAWLIPRNPAPDPLVYASGSKQLCD
ncbi:hypothetical protein H4R21_001410 [Coemansia helicoidea]|uniref:Uncharacterized protein n=1 Tax=Coemansia helicoidea TaxID=1286919 RepID=A0ACC1LBD8_9FUNG|nr:hypothetical protein H4R21_001410 [Coemansia helicoidea]